MRAEWMLMQLRQLQACLRKNVAHLLAGHSVAGSQYPQQAQDLQPAHHIKQAGTAGSSYLPACTHSSLVTESGTVSRLVREPDSK